MIARTELVIAKHDMRSQPQVVLYKPPTSSRETHGLKILQSAMQILLNRTPCRYMQYLAVSPWLHHRLRCRLSFCSCLAFVILCLLIYLGRNIRSSISCSRIQDQRKLASVKNSRTNKSTGRAALQWRSCSTQKRAVPAPTAFRAREVAQAPQPLVNKQ